MEKKHGLEVDLGRADKPDRNNKPSAVRDKKANT
jgi:hypothetical protein